MEARRALGDRTNVERDDDDTEAVLQRNRTSGDGGCGEVESKGPANTAADGAAAARGGDSKTAEEADAAVGSSSEVSTALRPGNDLHRAVVSGNVMAVRSLLEAGADPDGVNECGRTALLVAVGVGNSEMVQVLISGGADVEKSAKKGRYLWTPMVAAASRDDGRVVRLLLDAGARVHVRFEKFMETLKFHKFYGDAVSTAAYHGSVSAMRALLDGRGHPWMAGTTDAVDLALAVKWGHVEVARLLIDEGVDVDYEQNSRLPGPLIIAASNGDTDMVQLLLDAHADVHRTEAVRGYTAMHVAAKKGHSIVVEMLIGRGADVDRWGHARITALHLASRKGAIAVVRLLLDAGANMEASGGVSRRTPMNFAAKHGHEEVVALLLSRGADKDSYDVNRQTSLHLATRVGHDKVLMQLLQANANTRLFDNEGQPPAVLAAQLGHRRMLLRLLEARARLSSTQYRLRPLFCSSPQARKVTTVLHEAARKLVGATYCDGIDMIDDLVTAYPNAGWWAFLISIRRRGGDLVLADDPHVAMFERLRLFLPYRLAVDNGAVCRAVLNGRVGPWTEGQDAVLALDHGSCQWRSVGCGSSIRYSNASTGEVVLEQPAEHRLYWSRLLAKVYASEDVLKVTLSFLRKPRYFTDLDAVDALGMTAAEVAKSIISIAAMSGRGLPAGINPDNPKPLQLLRLAGAGV